MSRSHPVLAWSVTLLALTAYITGAAFMVLGLTGLSTISEGASSIVIALFATASVFACLLALISRHREDPFERPAIIRLPQTRSAKWALGLTAVFYLAVVLFTGNTLFDLMMALSLPDDTFQAVFRVVGQLGLWSIVASAVGAFVMALVALIKKDRVLVLGLPLLPALLVLGFILGELLGHG